MAAVAARAADVDVYDVDAVDTVVTEADLDWPATVCRRLLVSAGRRIFVIPLRNYDRIRPLTGVQQPITISIINAQSERFAIIDRSKLVATPTRLDFET